MNFTLGCDPEFALTYKGQFKSAIGILPEKNASLKKDGSSFYFDNVLAEIAVKPAKSKQDLAENIRKALISLSHYIAPAKIIIQASMHYPLAELKHPKAIEAGCVPELSAYTLKRVLPPEEFIVIDEANDHMKHITPFRTVGGHIHLGSSYGPLQNSMQIPYVIKMMDLFISIPELFFNKDKTSKDRRQVYGVAGTHRTPDYGLEYRPISNFWLSSPVYVGLIYDLCEFTLNFVEDQKHLNFWSIDEDLLDEDDPSVAHRCYGYDDKILRDSINNCDIVSARPFMTFISNYLSSELMAEIESAIQYEPKELNEEWNIK